MGLPFGRITNVLVLKGKNQAFLEMADEISATAMVACYTTTPPIVRGRTVYVQFSNHRELKTDQNHTNTVRHPPFPSFSMKYSCFVRMFRNNHRHRVLHCPLVQKTTPATPQMLQMHKVTPVVLTPYSG